MRVTECIWKPPSEFWFRHTLPYTRRIWSIVRDPGVLCCRKWSLRQHTTFLFTRFFFTTCKRFRHWPQLRTNICVNTILRSITSIPVWHFRTSFISHAAWRLSGYASEKDHVSEVLSPVPIFFIKIWATNMRALGISPAIPSVTEKTIAIVHK
jgi:hypothetical protein